MTEKEFDVQTTGRENEGERRRERGEKIWQLLYMATLEHLLHAWREATENERRTLTKDNQINYKIINYEIQGPLHDITK